MPYLRARGDFGIWFETHGERTNGTVMLLHGFTGAHSTWADLRKKLEGNYFIVVPDLPGHGRSGTPSAIERMNVDATSGNLVRLLNLLRVRRTALVGYSMGGRIALDFALKHRDRIACLILEGASPGIQDSREREKRKNDDNLLAKDIDRYGLDWFVERWEDTPLLSSQKALGSSVIRSIKKERLSNRVNGLSMSLRSAGTGNMRPLWDKLDRLEIPVLLIVGEKDEKFLAIAEAMKERLPNCTLEVVEGAGHCAHVERPDAFTGVVEQFLDTYAGEQTR